MDVKETLFINAKQDNSFDITQESGCGAHNLKTSSGTSNNPVMITVNNEGERAIFSADDGINTAEADYALCVHPKLLAQY